MGIHLISQPSPHMGQLPVCYFFLLTNKVFSFSFKLYPSNVTGAKFTVLVSWLSPVVHSQCNKYWCKAEE